MQTLGLSNSSERTENRLKSLFWPSIQSGADVDYLGSQGYWICSFVAIASFLFLLLQGRPILAFAVLLFFYIGGVGVRERDLLAAALVFAFYVMDTLTSLLALMVATPWGMLVFRILISALLLSNLRATWIASHWRPESDEAALPPRLAESWSDKFADRWPAVLWPKVRILYYVFALCFLLLALVGLANLVIRSSLSR